MIEAAISELEEAVKGDDKDAVEAKSQALIEASAKLAEIAQAKAQAGAGPEGAAAGAAADWRGKPPDDAL